MTYSGSLRSLEILIVEDSLTDAKLLAKAFAQISPAANLTILRDGESAIEFFLQAETSSENLLPDLILLDLHLPKKDGLAVLRKLKSRERIASIPVIMLTASGNQADITRCYKEEANCYLVKPTSLAEFEQVVQSLQDFWLQMVKLPFAP